MTPTTFQILSLQEKEQLLDVALNLSFRILINERIKEAEKAQLSLSETLPDDKFRFKYFQLQREIRVFEDLLQFLTNIREEFIEEK